MATKNISDLQVCQCVADMHRQQIKFGWRFQKVICLLMNMTGQPEKVCESAVRRAIVHGLVEWGIYHSIGWLTYEGAELLKRHDQ